nr:response regulator [uncultured Flavobacterium sp.]
MATRTSKKNNKVILVILLDIRMPEMDGFGFLSAYELLSEEIKRDTQIIMLSSTLDSNDIRKAKNNTYVKEIVSKPLPVEEFEKLISRNKPYKQKES